MTVLNEDRLGIRKVAATSASILPQSGTEKSKDKQESA